MALILGTHKPKRRQNMVICVFDGPLSENNVAINADFPWQTVTVVYPRG